MRSIIKYRGGQDPFIQLTTVMGRRIVENDTRHLTSKLGEDVLHFGIQIIKEFYIVGRIR